MLHNMSAERRVLQKIKKKLIFTEVVEVFDKLEKLWYHKEKESSMNDKILLNQLHHHRRSL